MRPPVKSKPFSLGVILLAAGASSRMGRSKMLLPWCATSVIGHLFAQWKSLGAKQITVVCGASDQAISDELDTLGFPKEHRILNPVPERGMFSSIQCAARWTGWSKVLTHWAVVLGDQPHLQEKTLRAIIDFTAAHPQKVCLPFQGGHRRHPVVLPAEVFRRLQNSTAQDLKQFLQTEDLARCEMDDPGLDLDIDRPEDYERAVQLFVRRQWNGARL
jgi:molybdenum cofactor cytidylyltransferase